MFCRNCGIKANENRKYCSGCGKSLLDEPGNAQQRLAESPSNSEQWWLRLARVMYILLYLPLIPTLLLVWNIYSRTYNYYTKTNIENFDGAAVLVFTTLIIYVLVLRSIKIIFQYIVLAKKPSLKDEFRRFY